MRTCSAFMSAIRSPRSTARRQGDPPDKRRRGRIGSPRPDRVTFLRGIGQARGGRLRDGRSGVAHEEERQAARSSMLGEATLPCRRCDAPTAPWPQPLLVTDELACPFCHDRGPGARLPVRRGSHGPGPRHPPSLSKRLPLIIKASGCLAASYGFILRGDDSSVPWNVPGASPDGERVVGPSARVDVHHVRTSDYPNCVASHDLRVGLGLSMRPIEPHIPDDAVKLVDHRLGGAVSHGLAGC